jgi:hypothetical protein
MGREPNGPLKGGVVLEFRIVDSQSELEWTCLANAFLPSHQGNCVTATFTAPLASATTRASGMIILG